MGVQGDRGILVSWVGNFLFFRVEMRIFDKFRAEVFAVKIRNFRGGIGVS